jgi:hypothetical protein
MQETAVYAIHANNDSPSQVIPLPCHSKRAGDPYNFYIAHLNEVLEEAKLADGEFNLHKIFITGSCSYPIPEDSIDIPLQWVGRSSRYPSHSIKAPIHVEGDSDQNSNAAVNIKEFIRTKNNIEKLPPVPTIFTQRMTQVSNKTAPTMQALEIDLDFTLNETGGENMTYILIGVTLHKSTGENKGHYKAVCRSSLHGKWFSYNNESVRIINCPKEYFAHKTIQEQVSFLVYANLSAYSNGISTSIPTWTCSMCHTTSKEGNIFSIKQVWCRSKCNHLFCIKCIASYMEALIRRTNKIEYKSNREINPLMNEENPWLEQGG